jgi:hypothetical protein
MKAIFTLTEKLIAKTYVTGVIPSRQRRKALEN